MKTLRLSGILAAVLISLAVLFTGLRATRSATASPLDLPAPHLGYGFNVWDLTQLMAGLGFDWIKLIEEAGLPPTSPLPYKVLYRVFVDGYPASIEDYKQHIRELVQAGRGKVQAYEIGNEPTLAYTAQQTMPKPYASALTVQPDALTFLVEVLTPTVQTRTFQIVSAVPGVPITWTIAVSSPGVIQPIVSPLTGANAATITVQLDSSPITIAGAYSATLFVTTAPTTGNDTPAVVSVSLIAVDQLRRAYLPLIARSDAPPVPTAPPVNQELGLSFVSSAESPASEIRYQHALSIEGRLNRWPMYWPNIEKNPITQPRVFDWSAQDANIIADINHGLTILPILMQTPQGLDTAGSRLVAPPRVGDGVKLLLNPSLLDRPTQPSSVASPPQGLKDSVFSDGSDIPGAGKSINPTNRWAVFVNAAVSRYKPGGTLAQAQGWSSDKGISNWEVWNEEDLDQFFIGTPTDFARLQKVAYLAAKQADPNATIVFGGLAHFQKPTWLQDVLDVIVTDPMSTTYHGFMDAVASHNYSWAYQTYLDLNEDRGRLDNHGLNTVKLWITETGLPVCDDPAPLADPPIAPFCPSTYRGTMSEQANFVIQTIVWAMAKNAEKIVWFQFYDDCGNDGYYDAFGLVRNPSTGPCTPRDGTPRPAYATYQLMHDLISNAQFYRWERRPRSLPWGQRTHEVLTFNRPATHDRVVFLWARLNTPVTAVLTATSASALMVYPDGSSQPITPVDGVYSIDLPAATNYSTPTSDGSGAIGGSPRIVVEYDPMVGP